MQTAPAPLAAGLEAGAKRLLRLAVAALARREHSRTELERKLQCRLDDPESPATPDDVAQILDRLQARALLSDQRMAQSLVRTRAARYGRLRIQRELERRGVDRATIAAALPAPAAEAATALALWRRKFGQAPVNASERARQARFLAARGFAPAVIARIVTGAADFMDGADTGS
jgi:regulatory protein